MLIAQHLILTGYGHWLPNDPRGSMSHEFRSEEIPALGEIHHGRVANRPPNEKLRGFYREAKPLLLHKTLWFTDAERQVLTNAIGEVVRRERFTCYALAVLRDHVHLLIRKHRLRGEDMIHRLKLHTRDVLRATGAVPLAHPVWSEDLCHLYKNTPDEVRVCIQYIWDNYTKHRLSPTAADFVTPYDNWPFHAKPM